MVVIIIEKWGLIAKITSIDTFSDFRNDILKLIQYLIFFKIIFTEIDLLFWILLVYDVNLSNLVKLLGYTSIDPYFLICWHFGGNKIVVNCLI